MLAIHKMTLAEKIHYLCYLEYKAVYKKPEIQNSHVIDFYKHLKLVVKN